MDDVRLIDANALMKQMVEVEIVTQPHNHYCSEMVVFGYDIDEAPTIDAVPVVRCRECKFRGFDSCPMCHDEYTYDEDDGGDYYTVDNTTDDGFCHMGAKMDGGSE